MKRPRIHDSAIIEASAAAWCEKAASRYPDIAGFDCFADVLAKAAGRSSALDPAEIAACVADFLHEPVDQELLDAMEDYLGHHRRTYDETVAKWLSAWGPARPFEGFSRIVASGPRGGEEEGVGLAEARYSRTGQFMFLPDAWRAEAVDPGGHVRKWRVVAWEDISQVLPMTDEDRRLAESHLAAQARLANESASARRKASARLRLEELVRACRAIDEAEAAALYAQLAGTPQKAARIIAALEKGAAAELEAQAASAGEEPRAPEGMLL